MAEAKKHPQVKLFFGLLISKPELLQQVIKRIELDFSPLDSQTELVPFTHTTYYQEEMGQNIFRKFISCQILIDAEEIDDVKIYTNRLERSYADPQTGKRLINIDPGYLTLSKVVLATTKDYDHRIYLDAGIYAEVTLHYKKQSQSFEPWEWTYPDYREPLAVVFFNELRQIYHRQLPR